MKGHTPPGRAFPASVETARLLSPVGQTGCYRCAQGTMCANPGREGSHNFIHFCYIEYLCQINKETDNSIADQKWVRWIGDLGFSSGEAEFSLYNV